MFESNIPDETCCTVMSFHITEKEKIIRYEKRTRTFGITVADHIIQQIYHCPWCGKKLADALNDMLFHIIYDELKLDSFSDDPRMPEEFKTDEWWKKRGL